MGARGLSIVVTGGGERSLTRGLLNTRHRRIRARRRSSSVFDCIADAGDRLALMPRRRKVSSTPGRLEA